MIPITDQSAGISDQVGLSGSSSLEGDDAQALNIQGYQHLLNREVEEALVCFQRALVLAPGNPVILNNLGNVLQNLNRPDEAQAAYHQAIAALESVVAAQPDHPQAAANLGVGYNTAGQPHKAIAIFESLLQWQPDSPSVMLNLGYACQDAGYAERAVGCFRQVIAMTTPDTPYAQRARQALDDMQSTVV